MTSAYKPKKGIIAAAGALLLGVAIPAVALIANGQLDGNGTNTRDHRLDRAFSLWQASDLANEQASLQTQIENELTAHQLSLIAAIEQSIPGIVCWGDSLTATVSGSGTAYPLQLQQMLQNELNASFARLFPVDFETDKSYNLTIPVSNMAVAGETSLTVAGRSGAIPYLLTEDITIPADTGRAVRIRFTSQNGESVEPLVRGSKGLGSVTVGGVEGTLEIRQAYDDGERYAYYFTRSEEGEQQTVSAGTPIVTSAEEVYKDCIAVIQLGHNGGWSNADELVAQIKAVVEAQANPDRYVVLGLAFGDAEELQTVNAALATAFGEHFIDLWQYMREDALADAGLQPTIEDMEAMADGYLPVSLTGGNSSFNQTAHRLIAASIQRKLHLLGYMNTVDEVFGEIE